MRRVLSFLTLSAILAVATLSLPSKAVQAQGYTGAAYTDGSYFVPPTACNSSVSGNSTGTNGFTVLGTAPSIPVVQAQTSATGTNTHYFTCNITPPSRITATRGASIVDVVFFYGVQTTGLGTQVAVLASGTLNAKTVFQSILFPTAGTSETATGLAEATRADSGTMVITPVVASSNVATTTAGEFYSVKIAPASAFAANADLTQYYATISLLNTATSATITNSPGALVHYTFNLGSPEPLIQAPGARH